jgi:hypothetical protein
MHLNTQTILGSVVVERLIAQRSRAHERRQGRLAAQADMMAALPRLLRAPGQPASYRQQLLWQWQRLAGEPYHPRCGAPEHVTRGPIETALAQAAIVEALCSLLLNTGKQPTVLQPTYRAEIERIWRLLAPASLAPPVAAPRAA